MTIGRGSGPVTSNATKATNTSNSIDTKPIQTGTVLQIAGAYVAWVMGSGFATGQEILQFFTSYGYHSFVLIGMNLLGFLLIGPMILKAGREHADDLAYDHFNYFCGRRLGTVYSWFLPLSMFAGMVILISGAGATMKEYYGVNHYVGALIMAAMALAAYIIGFQRFVRIVSLIGPAIITFSIFVGIVTVCRDYHGLSNVAPLMDHIANLGHSAADAAASAGQSAADAAASAGQSAADAAASTGQTAADAAASAGQTAADAAAGAGQTAADAAASAELDAAANAVRGKQPVAWWWLSGLLYISYNLCGGSKYYSALGKTARSAREAVLGGIVGTIALMASILLMNTAMLTDLGQAAQMDVPTLYLARKIAYGLGAVFSIILLMGIFSSCSAMLWTISEKFVVQGSRRSYIFAGCTCLCAFLLGLLPFADLVGVVYTILGYIGLVFAACVIRKRITH